MATDTGPRDTDLGGGRRDFPSTIWSTFLADSRGGRGALQELSRSYWKPVYSYIRAKWSRTNEDAKDRTQDFFLWIMESGFLDRVDPSRGRFRAFLKVALNHFLADHERMQRSQKRGGDHKILAMEGIGDDLPAMELPDPQGRTPEELLDETWRSELLSRGVEKLEQVLVQEGKDVYFSVFRDYFLSDGAKIEYREVAARYSIATADVSNYLMHVKKRFRAILSDLVAETVLDRADLESEMKWLFREEPRP